MTTRGPMAPRRSRRASPECRSCLSVIALCSLLCCAPSRSSSPPAPPAEPSAPALQLGELTDYVPAAGLRWLIAGSPRHFAVQPALRGARERWLNEKRLQAFAGETGIDLARTERA